jgi:tetratricopeptide (TPR) repeat protein
MRKRWVVATLVLMTAVGCQTGVSKEKIRAKMKWDQARSRVLAGCASEQMQIGDLEKAQQQATEALTLYPKNAKARVVLGKIHIERGQFSSAIYELERALEDDPRSAEAAYILGVAYEKSNNLPEALTCYEKSYRIDSRFFPAVVAAAEVHAGMGELEKGLSLLEGRLDQAGDDPAGYEVCGRMAMLLKDPAKAEGYFRTACVLDPENIIYTRNLAEAHFQMGHYRQAIQLLKKVVAHPEFKAGCITFSMLGECYLATGDGKKARDAYYTCTEISPAEPPLWVGLAKAYLLTGETARARLAAQQALQLDRSSESGAMLLGYALMREKHVGQAIAVLLPAAGKHPRSTVLRCLLGRAYAADGDKAQAARWFNAALQLEPDNAVARSLLEALRNDQLSRVD